MATKGYHQYRGRGRGSKTLLIVLLLLILLGACTFLFLQKYIVYDSDGGVHLELPFGKDSETGPDNIPDNEINIEREETPTPQPQPEPEPLVLTPLHAKELPYNCLNSSPASLLEGQEAVVVNIKRSEGVITYHTAIELPAGVSRGGKDTSAHLQTITGSNCYSVARIAALCDSAYAAANRDAAFTYAGGALWQDIYGRLWLDPTAEATADYLCALARECAQLGFDEILLDYMRFPIEGDLSQTTLGDTSRPNAMAALMEKIREAVGPEVAVSVLLPGSLDTTYAFKASGLTAKVLEDHFDRVYVPQGSAAYLWLDGTLSADFDRSTRLVQTAYAATEDSYMILQW